MDCLHWGSLLAKLLVIATYTSHVTSLALTSKGGITQIGSFLFLSCCPRWTRQVRKANGTARIRHQCKKTVVLSCHRFLIYSGVEKNLTTRCLWHCQGSLCRSFQFPAGLKHRLQRRNILVKYILPWLWYHGESIIDSDIFISFPWLLGCFHKK